MSVETSASESGEKDVNKCMFAGKMCLIDYGVENCEYPYKYLQMFDIYVIN